MTDVTGFGLLGHLHELALASGVEARVEASAVPAIEGALELLARARVAGGSRRNREWVEPHVRWDDDGAGAGARAAVRRDDLRRAAGRGPRRSARPRWSDALAAAAPASRAASARSSDGAPGRIAVELAR